MLCTQPRLQYPDPPLARGTDPSTSHEAAAKIRPKLKSLQRQTLLLIDEYPGRTATELARLGGHADPRRINRRISELAKRGSIVSKGVRKCWITGFDARTWIGNG